MTGNYLSFLKLAEDLAGNDTSSCTETGSDWRTICYQPDTGFNYYSKKAIRSHGENHQETFDYFSSGMGAKGVGYWHCDDIDPAGNIGNIQIQFEFLDMDACSSSTSGYYMPDFAEFRKADGTVVLQITGQEVYPGQPGRDAKYRLGNTGAWITPSGNTLDAGGWFFIELQNLDTDKLAVYWYNSGGTRDYTCECTQPDVEPCLGDPLQEYNSRGFVVAGYRYTSSGTGSSEFQCCNGPDGVGYKIQSRLEIAQKAMVNVVDATREKLNWGLAIYPDYSGTLEQGSAELRTNFSEGADAVIADINALNAYGSTPTGEALELSYNYYDAFLTANADAAQCSNNFIVLMTDGYPNRDDVWTYVTANTTTNPDFAGNQYNDGDSWAWEESGSGSPEYADDVAAWMANWQYAQPTAEGGARPDFTIKTHAIGFNFDNKILEDVAEDGGGYHITAYSREQLITAFYQLGLTMTSTVSFIAPVVSVDEANRTQSGDKLYMAFFKPEDDDYWKGNLKKYGLDWRTRSDCGRTEGEWTVVDADGNIATACNGTIVSGARSYWSATPDGVTVDIGGAGGVLLSAFDAVNIAGGPFYSFRNIYTYKNNNLVRFIPNNITNTDLSVATDNERYSIINFIYGYTYDADGSGNPVAKRNWILGDIIHSEPKVIEYFDPDDGLIRRYIAVGANDGMIHFFVDYDSSGTLTEGSEVFAFIPSDLLDDLYQFDDIEHFYTVDGSPNLWRGAVIDDDGDSQWDSGEYYEKILVFGERRGGRNYWALDVTDPNPANWDVAWRIGGGDFGFMALGQTWNKPQFARLQTGSSQFTDVCIFAGGYDPLEDGFPEPFEDDEDNPNGVYDAGTDIWNPATDDTNLNGSYDKHNLDGADDMGRGIYVVDVTDGTLVYSKDRWDSGYDQMRWCFPSDPAVIPISPTKLVMYSPDIYGQIWRVSYTYTDTGNWSTYRIFKANPGSDLPTGDENVPGNPDTDDTGRKMFAPPDISYFGNCWTSYPVLYFGTGDREHPNYAMISNRFYMIKDAFGAYDITEETDLLNLTCNELEDVTIPDLDGDGDGDADDALIQNDLKGVLTSGQARGAYRVLGEQGNCVSPADDHTGEKVLSQPTLFFNNLYFTTYQPTFGSACSAGGNARVYALDYCWLTSIFDLYSGNSANRDIRDTYQLISSSSIPSGVRVITWSGEAAGIISVAGAVSGVGEDQTTKIPGPPAGVTRMLWETD